MPDAIMPSDLPEQSGLIVQGPRQRSAQWGDLMVALAKAQGEIEGAKKDSQNPHFKSSYADLASVWAAIREPLSKNGLAIMQWPRVSENAVEIETIVAHGEQFISDVLWMPCAKMDAHGIGSAITYGRRYALMAVAGVAPEDDDGNGAAIGGSGNAQPPRRAAFRGGNYVEEAERDGLVDHNRAKGTMPNKAKPDTATARATKIREATNNRIQTLNLRNDWTRAELDQFWTDNATWIEWMSDPQNDALKEYERFTTAYENAGESIREIA